MAFVRPDTMRLPRSFADAIVAQAKAEYPNESCGLVAGLGGVATRVFPMANAERSPVVYRMEPKEQLRVFNEIDAEGLELLAIYHSHTRSAAYPSATDVSQAYYPDSVYLIVSLADAEKPDLRGFHIREGKVTEARLSIEDR